MLKKINEFKVIKRRLIAVLSFLLCLTLFVACAGDDDNEPPKPLSGSTFYLKSATVNNGNGNRYHDNTDSGYSIDLYNITFLENGNGFCNFGSAEDKVFLYTENSGSLIFDILSDGYQKDDNGNIRYLSEKQSYVGEYKNDTVTLYYEFLDGSITKTRKYVFERGTTLSALNYPCVYNGFIGKYDNKENNDENYVEIDVKENRLSDLTVHYYINSTDYVTAYENCVSIISYNETSKRYIIKIFFADEDASGVCQIEFNESKEVVSVYNEYGKYPSNYDVVIENSTYYLKEVKISSGGSFSTDQDDAYTSENYNITFLENGEGLCRFGTAIDRKIEFTKTNEKLTVNILSDAYRLSGYDFIFVLNKQTYNGNCIANEITLTTDFSDGNETKTRIYVFERGETKSASDYKYVYENFTGKYTNKPESGNVNYVELDVKDDYKTDVTVYTYVQGGLQSTTFSDCVTNFRYDENKKQYYLVVKYTDMNSVLKVGEYVIKFDVNLNCLNFKVAV